MRAIAIENLKGGVGKTVTTISLAHILVEDYRQRVLVVDCDGQCNLTRFYLNEVPEGLTLANVLEGSREPYWLDNVVGVRPGLLLLPASPDLYRLDLSAIQLGASGLTALADFLEAVAEDQEVDVVLFDCPPGFTTASTAALIAAREIIIPVEIERFALEGMAALMNHVESLRQSNPALHVSGVMINKWHKSSYVELVEKLIRSMHLPVFNQVIRKTDKVPESTFDGNPVMDYSPTSAASRDYRLLCQEIFGEVQRCG